MPPIQQSQKMHAILVPLGPAWQKVRKKKPGIELYQPDRAHPSPLSTYLIVCVFYKALLKKSPVGLPPQSYDGKVKKYSPHLKLIRLDSKDAIFLQKASRIRTNLPL
jgi:hypothetical protein